MTFRLRHLFAALLLHGALVVLLVTGVQCSRQPVRPAIIQAVLLDPSRTQVAEQKKQQQADAQRRQEQQRQEQQEKQRQEQIQKQKAADEQKRQQQLAAEQKKQQAIAEQQRKQKAAADAAAKKKADEQARKKKEQDDAKERQREAQLELQEKARMEDEMRQESSAIKAQQQREAQAATDRERKQSEWALILSDRIRQNWYRPGNAPDDFKCTVHVQLLPDGTVTRAQISQSCGNPQLDRSVEDATLRASPLPKPADPSVFDRDLIINFEP